MKITLEQVRLALLIYADQQKRPHYAMYIVREVLDAIRNNTWHPLKQATLQVIFADENLLGQGQRKPEPDLDPVACMEKINEVRKYFAGQKLLSKSSGISERTISLIIKGKAKINVSVWNKLSPVIDEVISVLEQRERNKEAIPHGEYTRYRRGCRCADCKTAWNAYILTNKRKKLAQKKVEI